MQLRHALLAAAAAASASPLLAQRYLVAEDEGLLLRLHLLDTRVGARFEYDKHLLSLTNVKDVAYVAGELWVSRWTFATGSTIDRFDLATGAVLGTIPTAGFTNVLRMAVVADGVWLAGSDRLEKRDFTGAAVVAMARPYVVDVASDGADVLALSVPNAAGPTVVERYGPAGNLLGQVFLGQTGSLFNGLEIRASNGNFLFTGGVGVVEFDGATGSYIASHSAGPFPQGALELVDGRLLSLNWGNAKIVDVEGTMGTSSEVPATFKRQFRSLTPFDAGDPGARRFCPSGANSSGEAARIGVRGATATWHGSLWLDAFGGPAGAFGFFVYGVAGAPQTVGNGTLCIGPTLLRTATAGTFDAAGNRTRVELPYASTLGAGPVVAGSTWAFQYVFRDSAGAGYDLSDAVELTFE